MPFNILPDPYFDIFNKEEREIYGCKAKKKMPYTKSYASSIRLPPSCQRHAVSRRAPLTDAQREERSAASRKCQDKIDDAVHDWKASTLTLATDLARHFNKKPCYFLDLFFQGGVHLVHKQTKVNPHNAFLSMKAQELCDSVSH